MGDEGEIFLTPMLDLERPCGGVRLHGEADCLVQDPVEDVKRLALQAAAMAFREIVNATAQDVVLGNHFDNVETVLHPLHSVRGRTALAEGLGNRLIRADFEGGG